ncbi:hypothetical protein AB0912_22280 [Streptomyces sp. NPDC007084]|uniref:hypothetical protein n=1 Tax=Streptomyces sp. NPDC007084 TaxID=3154313 RepID=UPI003454087D
MRVLPSSPSPAEQPHVKLAAEVIADLETVGIPVFFLAEDDDYSHIAGGLVIRPDSLTEGVFLSWHVPEENHLVSVQSVESARAFSAAAAMTSASAGILTSFGYHVKAEFADPAFPYPVIYVRP